MMTESEPGNNIRASTLRTLEDDPPLENLLSGLGLNRTSKVVLVVDLVESVRLMQEDEVSTVRHWRTFMLSVKDEILPRNSGRLVKSLGDGLMAEFQSVASAVVAAADMHKTAFEIASISESPRAFQLRGGITISNVYQDELDLYGAGVNLAARLSGLARPSETVISSDVRAEIIDGLDGEIEDLGNCYLKHYKAPVRAWALRWNKEPPAQGRQSLGVEVDLRPTIAVIPFSSTNSNEGAFALGELIADGVIAQLSRSQDLKVISRLSTTGLKSRDISTSLIEKTVGANYVVWGTSTLIGSRVLCTFELLSTRTNEVVHAGRLAASLEDLFALESTLIGELAGAVHSSLVSATVRWVKNVPLPSLSSYEILLAGIGLMHRQTKAAFFSANRLFEHLVERHPRSAVPRSWWAKWYVLMVAQGWAEDTQKATIQARQMAMSALDYEPENALSLAVGGLVSGFLHRNFREAKQFHDAAIASNPNESLAWLFRSAVNSYLDLGVEGVADAVIAMKLSPIDPLRYYYENFAMTSALAAGDYPRAVSHGETSRRLNREHGSTLRILTIAYGLAGQEEKSRQLAKEVLAHEPNFTVEVFSSRHPASEARYFADYKSALIQSGIPLI